MVVLSTREEWLYGFPPEAGPPLAERLKIMSGIYVLKSETTGRMYIGSTRHEDFNIRLAEHNLGKTKSTKHGRPWALVHSERYDSFTEARKRENFLKSGFGRRLIGEIIRRSG